MKQTRSERLTDNAETFMAKMPKCIYDMLYETADYIDELEEENAKLRELLGDALKTLFHKRLDGSVGCTENCPRWQFGKDCQLVDGCWLEIEAARLGIEVPDGS